MALFLLCASIATGHVPKRLQKQVEEDMNLKDEKCSHGQRGYKSR